MRNVFFGCLLALGGCATAKPSVELVQSAPVESGLADPAMPHAHQVWLRMIRGAQRRIDIAQFYISNTPDGRLEPIIAAIEARAEAGVAVRVLIEKLFEKQYPKTLARLQKHPRIEVRRYDIAKRTGGILHAKYFLIDGREAYFGSQNFDWRALEHIQELGARVQGSAEVAPLQALFEADWALAGGATELAKLPSAPNLRWVFSPKPLLPQGAAFDLDALLAQIKGAKDTIQIQLLSYKAAGRDGTPFLALDKALREAAARGVKVQLLLSHWVTGSKSLPALQDLGKTKGIQLKILTVPPWSGGFVPFGRVNHAKLMVVDGERGWLGTSNWSRDYFYSSRNVGLLLSGALAEQLQGYFVRGWSSEYTKDLKLQGSYPKPRVAK